MDNGNQINLMKWYIASLELAIRNTQASLTDNDLSDSEKIKDAIDDISRYAPLLFDSDSEDED